MEKWPVEKKKRVFEIVRSLNLPEKGDAIDYGCGNGIFTDVLRQALPGWRVYGTDISSVAVENAKSRFPECNFIHISDEKMSGKKFNLLFTHHVIEHVYNVDDTLADMDTLVYSASRMLHILPCGNKGSFEHSICLLKKDGINQKLNNRYFFEEEGHIRRLNTEQMCSMFERYGYRLEKDFYANQYHGAIKWIISEDMNFINKFTDSSNAINAAAADRLKKLRKKLIFFHYAQKYGSVVSRKKSKKHKSFKDYFTMVVGLVPFLLFYPIISHINNSTTQEWDTLKEHRNGSEMYLCFVREPEKVFE
jgi:ubiquinone/menaquinone biosynthesis C-methylase UbiE